MRDSLGESAIERERAYVTEIEREHVTDGWRERERAHVTKRESERN